MSEYLSLDAWDDLWNEMNDKVSMQSYMSRFVMHALSELVFDFFPNFAWCSNTQRFIRAPMTFVEDVNREPVPSAGPLFLYGSKGLSTAYKSIVDLTEGFFGRPHMEALMNIIDVEEVPLIVSEVLKNTQLKIDNALVPYISSLMQGMPPSSKLPMFDYGTEGCYGYFQLKLKPILNYAELRPEVLHNFRELGNTLVFLQQLDIHLLNKIEKRYFLTMAHLGVQYDCMPNEVHNAVSKVINWYFILIIIRHWKV